MDASPAGRLVKLRRSDVMQHIGAWVSVWTATPVTWRTLVYINPRGAWRMAVARGRVDIVRFMLEEREALWRREEGEAGAGGGGTA